MCNVIDGTRANTRGEAESEKERIADGLRESPEHIHIESDIGTCVLFHIAGEQGEQESRIGCSSRRQRGFGTDFSFVAHRVTRAKCCVAATSCAYIHGMWFYLYVCPFCFFFVASHSVPCCTYG